MLGMDNYPYAREIREFGYDSDVTSTESASMLTHAPPLSSYGMAGWGNVPGGWHATPAVNAQMFANQFMPDMNTSMNTAKYDPAPVSPPPQRERFSYTRYQLELLNAIYRQIRYPNSMQKQLVAKRIGITRDQVKIWFQNRRRKDIVGNKGKKDASQTNDASAKKMVPDAIMNGVLNELLKYDKDPTGKLSRATVNAKAVRPTAESSPSPTDTVTSTGDSCTVRTPESVSPVNTQQQLDIGDAHTHELSDHSCSPASQQQQSSPETYASLASTGSLKRAREDDSNENARTVPTLAELDMIAPPNVVAPHSDITKIKSSLCVTDTTHTNVTKRLKLDEDWKPNGDDISNTSMASTLPYNDCFPPNRVVESCEPIKFYQSNSNVTEPLSVDIPQTEIRLASPVPIADCHRRPQHRNEPADAYPNYMRDNNELGLLAKRNNMDFCQQYGYMDTMHRQPMYAPEHAKHIDRLYAYPVNTDNQLLLSSIGTYPGHYAASGDAYQPIRLQHLARNPYYSYDMTNFVTVSDRKSFTDL